MDRKAFLITCLASSVILTLLTRLFFDHSTVSAGFPLKQNETTLVFGFWLILTAVSLSIWKHYRNKPRRPKP